MFQTVRRWWTGGRGKITARLFLFEFVVVVLGVLVAQWVADWARERSDLAVMEQARKRMQRDIAQGATNVRAWMIALPCLEEKLDSAMRAAGGTASIDPQILERPGFRTFRVEPLPAHTSLLLIDRHGSEKALLYSGLQERSERLSFLSNRAAERWMALTVLDARYGQVRDGDRVNAREAASDIRSALRSLAIGARGYLEEASRLGVTPEPIAGRRLPRDCADIAAAGSMMPYRDGRRN